MFFPEKIKSIKTDDKVLEIGPGGNPHPRADILLERDFKDLDAARAQRGNAPELVTDKEVVYYDGARFPFKDKEFDYVICSHVLEHVERLDAFISEVNRVGKAGYLEYPLIYYDYVYNIPKHVNILKKKDGKVFWSKKEDLGMEKFGAVNRFFLETLDKEYTALIRDLKQFLFEGFEWSGVIELSRTASVEDLVFQDVHIPMKERRKRGLFRRIKRAVTFGGSK